MTAEPTIPFPASPYCRVRARVASIWADGPDDGTHPDWIPAAGERVTLTPSIGSQLLTYDVGGPSPIIVTVERVECVVDEDGWLAKADGRPVFIAPTDDPLLSAVGWTWTASIKGKTVAFAAPSGGVVDLAVFIAAPATDDTKAWVERIPELIDIVATAGTTAVDAAAAAEAARDTATGAASTATGAASTATEQAGLATTARTGAEAALAATLAASTIVGAGRPDVPATMTADVRTLVSAATSGAVFRSTDGPQGAWEWQKQGTTWVVTQGELETLIATIPDTPGATLHAPGIRLTRHPQLVTVEIDRIDFTADYVGNSLTINVPVGFRPAKTAYIPGGAYGGSVKVWFVTASSGAMSTPSSGASPAYRHRFSWVPRPDWPTTLTF